MSSRQSRKTSVFPGEGAYSPASGLNSAGLMPRGFNGSALPAPAPQGVGQQRGMLPLMLGLNMLQNNQARPYNQGPPSIGAGLAGGMQQYLQYQQQQQDQAAQQAQYDQELGFKQRAESRASQSHAASMKPKVRDPGQGYAWNDPSDPSKGVYTIPGYGDEKESWEYTDNGVVYDMFGPPGNTDSEYVVGTTAQFKGEAETAAQKTLDALNQAKRDLVNAKLAGNPEAIAAAESDLKYWKVQAHGAPAERKKTQAADGYWYYDDDGIVNAAGC